MTDLRELLTEVIALARMPVSDRDFIDNYNRAVFDLENKYDTAKIITKRTVNCTDTRKEYPLAEGALGVVRVLNAGGYYTSNYDIREDSIIFGSLGIYFVYEKLHNPRITSIDDDTPTINSSYNYPIIHYIASKLCNDPKTAESLMQDYVLMSDQVNFNLKGKKPTRTMKAPIFR